jgi:hypothetical protein
MHSTMRFAATAALLGGSLFAGCSDVAPAADRQAGIDWQAIEYPIFEGIEAQCSARAGAVAAERREGVVNHTHVPSEIQWAADFPDAIARATREGKPIFIASSVRKGGNPDCSEV